MYAIRSYYVTQVTSITTVEHRIMEMITQGIKLAGKRIALATRHFSEHGLVIGGPAILGKIVEVKEQMLTLIGHLPQGQRQQQALAQAVIVDMPEIRNTS